MQMRPHLFLKRLCQLANVGRDKMVPCHQRARDEHDDKEDGHDRAKENAQEPHGDEPAPEAIVCQRAQIEWQQPSQPGRIGLRRVLRGENGRAREGGGGQWWERHGWPEGAVPSFGPHLGQLALGHGGAVKVVRIVLWRKGGSVNGER